MKGAIKAAMKSSIIEELKAAADPQDKLRQSPELETSTIEQTDELTQEQVNNIEKRIVKAPAKHSDIGDDKIKAAVKQTKKPRSKPQAVLNPEAEGLEALAELIELEPSKLSDYVVRAGNNGGGPKKAELTEKGMLKLFELMTEGYDHIRIARILGIGRTRFYEILKESPKIANIAAIGRHYQKTRVEGALLDLALGKSKARKVVKVKDGQGRVTATQEETRYSAPDYNAIRFWLINHDPDTYQSAPEGRQGVTVVFNAPMIYKDDEQEAEPEPTPTYTVKDSPE